MAIRLIGDFVRLGYEVDLVLMAGEGELIGEVPPQVRVFDLGAPRIRNVLLPLRRYLRRETPVALQAFMWPLTVAAVVAKRLAGSQVRLVTSDHIVLSRQYSHSAVKMALLRITTRLFYPLADACVIVSQAAAADLVWLSELPRDRVEVIYNPVAGPPPKNASNPEIEALWGDADGRVITVGSLKAQKNHALLIRAFQDVVKQRGAKLMILGDGPLKRDLQMLAEKLGLSDRIVFPGFALDPWPYYASANLFVLSSDYEGYPLVLIEAMRAGLNIVSTNCESGPDEILDGGRYGRLVPVRDEAALSQAILETLKVPGDSEPVQSRAEVLSGDRTSQRYLELMLG